MSASDNLNNLVFATSAEIPLSSEKMRIAFLTWLSAGKSKKLSADACVSCIDKISAYAMSKKLCTCSIWDITNHNVFKSVNQKILDAKLLRIADRSTYKTFINVGRLYLTFLKEKPWSTKAAIESVLPQGPTGTTEPTATVEQNELQKIDINSDDVVAWLVTQPNTNGTLFLERVARRYMRSIQLTPRKLDIALESSSVFSVHTVLELDRLWDSFKSAPNYAEANRNAGHGEFSAGLAAYRRYLEFIEKNGVLEMHEQEIVVDSVSAVGEKRLQYADIIYIQKQSTGGLKSVIKIKDNSAQFAQQTVRNSFRAWLAEQHPEWSNSSVSMCSSDAYYLHNNERGITLEEALTADDGLQRAYDAIERYYINNPTQTNNPTGSARGYLRSLRLLKEFLADKKPEMLDADLVVESAQNVPDSLIAALNHKYTSGLRFDSTYINLLSSTSGVEVDEHMQSALKRIMFRRNDGVYFLLDTVAAATTRKDIVDFADTYLQEYGCFEIPEFYKLFEDKVNQNCIRNADDFESFYEQIGKSGVRCVAAPGLGNRIARFSNGNVWGTFKEVAGKIVSVITEEYYGSCNEDDLHTKFCAFSTDLLGKIIKQCAADELIRVDINDSVCYQTFDALGLPENFSEVLAEALERLSDIGLDPTQDALHTTLSLKLGVNFKAEYNLPDWDTYRRLIAAFYKAEPRREWKYNIFGEVIR